MARETSCWVGLSERGLVWQDPPESYSRPGYRRYAVWLSAFILLLPNVAATMAALSKHSRFANSECIMFSWHSNHKTLLLC